MEDLSGIRQAVRNALGVPPGDPLASNEKLNGWINAANQHLSTERDWPWLNGTDSDNAATVADQQAYDVPADYRDTLSVTIEGMPLRRISIGTSDSFGSYGDWHSVYHYAVEEGQLLISPVPSEALTMVHRYVRDEPQLVADDDEPLLEKRWRYALVLKACAYAAPSLDQPSGGFNDEYNSQVQKMIRHIRPKPRVYVRPGGGL